MPVRLAEAQNVLPLAIDPERKLLSVVAAEPQNKKLLDEIALVTGMAEVYAYVGLRSTIAAAIRKHYYGDTTAFASLEVVTASDSGGRVHHGHRLREHHGAGPEDEPPAPPRDGPPDAAAAPGHAGAAQHLPRRSLHGLARDGERTTTTSRR